VRPGTKPFQVTIFEGGVAVLTTTKQVAIVEFLDEQDDPSYFSMTNSTSHRILPTSALSVEAFGGGKGDTMPPFCGLVTFSPTVNAQE
jgi:hypothetical protein